MEPNRHGYGMTEGILVADTDGGDLVPPCQSCRNGFKISDNEIVPGGIQAGHFPVKPKKLQTQKGLNHLKPSLLRLESQSMKNSMGLEDFQIPESPGFLPAEKDMDVVSPFFETGDDLPGPRDMPVPRGLNSI
jgi:hypothetical protein